MKRKETVVSLLHGGRTERTDPKNRPESSIFQAVCPDATQKVVVSVGTLGCMEETPLQLAGRDALGAQALPSP